MVFVYIGEVEFCVFVCVRGFLGLYFVFGLNMNGVI